MDIAKENGSRVNILMTIYDITIIRTVVQDVEKSLILKRTIALSVEQGCIRSKNMADDYIHREDAIRLAEQGQVQGFPWQFQMLLRLSSADVAPVIRGKWIHDGHHRRCDRCGTYFCNTDREGDTIPDNFCPHCGAKMDAQREE